MRAVTLRAVLAWGLMLAVPAVPAAWAQEPAGPGGVGPEPFITLNLHKANIVDVLNTLAQRHRANLVIGPGVTGEVSVNLHRVSLTEALRSVAQAGGCAATEQGGVHFISKAQGKGDAPTDVRTIRLDYADVEDAAQAITGTVGGEVKAYKGTRTLVLKDTPENLELAERVARAVDSAPKQVLIEAKILEVTLSDALSFGIDWKRVFNWGATLQTQGLSLPATSPGATGLFFDVSREAGRFEAAIDALREITDVNMIATPKLLALDHREAQILIGSRLGYKTAFISETSTTETVQFLDVGTELRLTPHIAADGSLVMQLYPKVSDGVVTNGIPNETTTEVSTTVLARNGETIFIGGLIRTKEEKTENQVPLLGSIPVLGYLFKRVEETKQRSEIIILITPHILPAAAAPPAAASHSAEKPPEG